MSCMTWCKLFHWFQAWLHKPFLWLCIHIVNEVYAMVPHAPFFFQSLYMLYTGIFEKRWNGLERDVLSSCTITCTKWCTEDCQLWHTCIKLRPPSIMIASFFVLHIIFFLRQKKNALLWWHRWCIGLCSHDATCTFFLCFSLFPRVIIVPFFSLVSIFSEISAWVIIRAFQLSLLLVRKGPGHISHCNLREVFKLYTTCAWRSDQVVWGSKKSFPFFFSHLLPFPLRQSDEVTKSFATSR